MCSRLYANAGDWLCRKVDEAFARLACYWPPRVFGLMLFTKDALGLAVE